MKCISCNQRKGQRSCPALEGLICTQCCGNKRGVEIRCPDECPYFAQAMGKKWFDLFHPVWSRIKEEGERGRLLDSVDTCFPLIIYLQRTLLGTLLELADASDETILEALKLLAGGYHAAQNGIIYEPSSANLNVQAIVRKMRARIAEEEEENRIPPEFLAESFRIMALIMDNYISGKPDSDSCFQFLRQFHPTVEPPEPESAGIIITG